MSPQTQEWFMSFPNDKNTVGFWPLVSQAGLSWWPGDEMFTANLPGNHLPLQAPFNKSALPYSQKTLWKYAIWIYWEYFQNPFV